MIRFFHFTVLISLFLPCAASAVPQLKLINKFTVNGSTTFTPAENGGIIQRGFDDVNALENYTLRSSTGTVVDGLIHEVGSVRTNTAGDVLTVLASNEDPYSTSLEIRYVDGSRLRIPIPNSSYDHNVLSEDGGVVVLVREPFSDSLRFYAKSETIPPSTLDITGLVTAPFPRLLGSKDHNSVILEPSRGELVEISADGTKKIFDVGFTFAIRSQFLENNITRLTGNNFDASFKVIENCDLVGRCEAAPGWQPGIVDLDDSGLRIYQEGFPTSVGPFEMALSENSTLRDIKCLLPKQNELGTTPPRDLFLLRSGKVFAAFEKGKPIKTYAYIYALGDGPVSTASSCVAASVVVSSTCKGLFTQEGSTFKQTKKSRSQSSCRVNFRIVDDIGRAVYPSAATLTGIPNVRGANLKVNKDGRGSFTLPLSKLANVKLTTTAFGRYPSATRFQIRGR